MPRWTRWLFLPFVLVFGVWVFFAPHLTVRSMRLAAKAGDAERLSRHIDYPALRESVKQELSKEMGERISGFAGDSRLGRIGERIAGVFGGAALDPAVDTLVRPEALSMMLAGRDLANEYSLLPSGEQDAIEGVDAPDLSEPQSASSSQSQPSPHTNALGTSNFRATMGYESLGRFAVNVQEPYSGRHVTLIMTRDKLLWWKLSAVELPPG
jgi:hypothetical protein